MCGWSTSRASLAAFRDGHPVQGAAAAAGFGAVDQLAMVNVAVQLERLQGHPSVAGALQAGTVQLTGLFYDIPTARVLQVTADGIGHLHPLPAARPATRSRWQQAPAPPDAQLKGSPRGAGRVLAAVTGQGS